MSCVVAVGVMVLGWMLYSTEQLGSQLVGRAVGTTFEPTGRKDPPPDAGTFQLFRASTFL